jgi:hypothetical protein
MPRPLFRIVLLRGIAFAGIIATLAVWALTMYWPTNTWLITRDADQFDLRLHDRSNGDVRLTVSYVTQRERRWEDLLARIPDHFGDRIGIGLHHEAVGFTSEAYVLKISLIYPLLAFLLLLNLANRRLPNAPAGGFAVDASASPTLRAMPVAD